MVYQICTYRLARSTTKVAIQCPTLLDLMAFFYPKAPTIATAHRTDSKAYYYPTIPRHKKKDGKLRTFFITGTDVDWDIILDNLEYNCQVASVFDLFEFSRAFCVFRFLNPSNKGIKTNAAADSALFWHLPERFSASLVILRREIQKGQKSHSTVLAKKAHTQRWCGLFYKKQ